jgi:hypothetical protein
MPQFVLSKGETIVRNRQCRLDMFRAGKSIRRQMSGENGVEYRKLTEERENGELQIVARDRDDKNVFNGVIVGKRKSIILRQKGRRK